MGYKKWEKRKKREQHRKQQCQIYLKLRTPTRRWNSLYETPIEDLAVLEKLPELVELSLCGNENAEHIEVVGNPAVCLYYYSKIMMV